MKFTSREDLEASASEAWEILTDVAALERAALRRGATVTQTAGPKWHLGFTFRGKAREAVVSLPEQRAPERLRAHAVGPSMEADVVVELQALSPKRTRMSVTVEVKARKLTARLFLQSLKLARGKVEGKFQKGVSDLAGYIEKRAKGG